MPERLFTFVQLELPWTLGPADGRYLLRASGGPRDGAPEHVVVLRTLGAQRRGRLSRRARTRPTSPEPEPVAIARATIVDPVPLAAERQAQAWLEQLDPDREAQAAALVLNRVLFAHRIACASPAVHEISPAHATLIRAGYGDGERVAEGQWLAARELVLSHGRARRRAAVLRPQERLAMLLSGRGSALLCEELALRARLDLDEERVALAAIELDRAYEAALQELPAEQRKDLAERIAELGELQPGVAQAARDARGVAEAEDPAQRAVVQAALERLEAALRARTAAGFAPNR